MRSPLTASPGRHGDGKSGRMRVLLVAPSALDMAGAPIRQSRVFLPGLTLAMLKAVTPEDVDLHTISDTTSEIPYDQHWDLVGVTGMGSGIVRAWQIADEFRRRGVTVVQGGIAATLGHPDVSLAHADCLVQGEAEEVWPRVLQDFAGGRLQRLYRAERPPDIEHLPEPDLSAYDGWRLGFWRPVQATRGCPFPCSFCSIQSFFKRTYRKVPVEDVIRNVRAAKRHGRTKFIAFIDDNIGVDFKYCAELWEALIPEKIIWMSQCSLHIADRPEMLALAYKSGCRLLSIGIETVNRESLELVLKDFNHPSQYHDSIRAIRSHGIDVSTEMIVGLDSDGNEVFDDTFDFLMKNRITVPRVHIMTPIPGTGLWQQMEAEGRILSADFSRYSGGRVVFRPRNFSPDALQAGYWRLYERLFTVRAITHRLRKNEASLGMMMRAFVTGVNLHYRGHIRRRITPGIV